MKFSKKINCGVVATSLLLGSGATYAAGFQISEATVAGLGRAFAGAGVAGDDASDVFYNPAGMTLVNGRTLQLGASIVNNQLKFSGSAQPFGGIEDDSGGTVAIPNFYYVAPISDSLTYGLSVTVPFGIDTKYESNWAGRYQGLKTELTVIDISPALAYKVSDAVSLGGSLSIQHSSTTLSQAQFLGVGVDGVGTVEGDTWALGYNLGAMFTPSDIARFGIGYRSGVTHSVSGDLTITDPIGRTIASAGAEAEVSLPDTLYISGAISATDSLELFGTARWTKWSAFEELRIKYDNGLPDSVTPENWEDSWTVSFGANIALNDQWILRAGYAKDNSPVPDEYRTVRTPDADRDWFTLGASFSPSDKLTVDFGYALLVFDDAPISETSVIAGPPTAPTVVQSGLEGSYDNETNIIGIQLQYSF